jgi:hypothetical protein
MRPPTLKEQQYDAMNDWFDPDTQILGRANTIFDLLPEILRPATNPGEAMMGGPLALRKVAGKAAPNIAKAVSAAAAKKGASVAAKGAPTVAPAVTSLGAPTKSNALMQALKNHPWKSAGMAGTLGAAGAALGKRALSGRGGAPEEVPPSPGLPGMGRRTPRMGMEGPPQSSGPDFGSLDQLINQLNGPGQAQPQQNPLAQTQQNPLQSAVLPQQEKGFDWMKMLQVVGPLLAAVLASRAGR